MQGDWINWGSKAMRELKAHPLVEEVEGEGMDPGRFFVHLVDGHTWVDHYGDRNPQNVEHSRSFGGAVEALKAVKRAVPCICTDCEKACPK
jgi:hypothetical protein